MGLEATGALTTSVRVKMRASERDADRGTLPLPAMLSTDTVPPEFRKLMHQSWSPMPVPSCGASAAVFDPVEALEHSRKFLRRNADACVAHREHGFPVLRRQAHFNPAVDRELGQRRSAG